MLLMVVARCFGFSAPSQAQQPAESALHLSNTGSFATRGQDLGGYQLCVKHANEKGDLLGCKSGRRARR